eukprot:3086415-Pleurochrysis_carterae.AAC.3
MKARRRRRRRDDCGGSSAVRVGEMAAGVRRDRGELEEPVGARREMRTRASTSPDGEAVSAAGCFSRRKFCHAAVQLSGRECLRLLARAPRP